VRHKRTKSAELSHRNQIKTSIKDGKTKAHFGLVELGSWG